MYTSQYIIVYYIIVQYVLADIYNMRCRPSSPAPSVLLRVPLTLSRPHKAPLFQSSLMYQWQHSVSCHKVATLLHCRCMHWMVNSWCKGAFGVGVFQLYVRASATAGFRRSSASVLVHAAAPKSLDEYKTTQVLSTGLESSYSSMSLSLF